MIVRAQFKGRMGQDVGTFDVYKADDAEHAASVIGRVNTGQLPEVTAWMMQIQSAMGAVSWTLIAVSE